jgi:hypothetical protein
MTNLLAYSVPCCDNCTKIKNPTRKFTDITEFLEFMFPVLSINESVPQITTTDLSAKAIKGMGPRREERRAACRGFLEKWRVDRWLENHREEVWGPDILLPDKVLTKLAAAASLQTKEDIKNEVEGWWLWERYSQEVLDGLKAIDMRFEAAKVAKEADRLEQQRIERERRTAIVHAEKQRALKEKEMKRLLKEATAQEEKRLKEAAKRRREELKREKEKEKAEAKRQREEVKRQKEEEKAEAKRLKEEAKRQREAKVKRQREEGRTEGDRDQPDKHEEKRRRTNHTSFIPIPSSSSTSIPTILEQSTLPTHSRPRPRPTKRLPPAHNHENVDPTSQSISSYPAFPVFPSFTEFYVHGVQPQFMPLPHRDVPLPHPSLQTAANIYYPHPQPTMLPPHHLPHCSSQNRMPPQAELSTSGTEYMGPHAIANPGVDQHRI